MIRFVTETFKDKETHFAIAENAKWMGQYYNELLFCELTPNGLSVSVSWEDDWQNPISFVTLEEAKAYVLHNYTSHEPHKQGEPWIE